MQAPRRHQPSITLVSDTRRLAAALDDLDAAVVGIDVERADADRYHRRAAVVQVGADGHCVLVDVLAIPDLGAVGDYLKGRLAVFHAVHNDLAPLRATGVRPSRLADTAVAAKVLGLPTGLGPLLERVLGVALAEGKERYQRADWEARPLPGELLEYAAHDVADLARLWQELAVRLERAGRRSWYEQELEAVVERARAPDRDWRRTRGAERLTPPQRAVLRALWEEREDLAREHDLAPQYLLHDRVLVALATDPPPSPAELTRRARRPGTVTQHAARLHAAVQRGRRSAPEELPTDRADARTADAARAMRHARAAVARRIGIDPGVVCPSRQLRAAALAAPSRPEELCALAGLRPWQRDLLEDVLWEAYTRAGR